mmetsp:Transcript_88217/g.254421  ORF Transcript_88217/g.254421 Transcript_88217/m.254421 type:complete len:402 (+) Transcript_88217:395-1600(+)
MSKTLPVHDHRAGLVVLRLRDPPVMEGRQRCEDGAADPHGVFALRRRHDPDLHRGRGEGHELLGQPLADAGEHRAAAGEHDVGVQVPAQVHVATHDALVDVVVDARSLPADQGRIEQGLRAPEALAAEGDEVAIWQLVGALLARSLAGLLQLGIEIQGHIAGLLFRVPDDLLLRRSGEGVPPLQEDFHQVFGEVPAGEIQAHHRVRQRVAFIDGNDVGDAVAGVHHDPRRAARGVQGEDGLNGDVHRGHVKGLEHVLADLLPVGFRIQGRLGEQDRVLLRADPQLIEEGVVPDLFHVIPVGHDAVLDGVRERQDAAFPLRLLADVALLVVHADEDAAHLRPADDRREHGAWRVLAREARLDDAAAIVADERHNLFGDRHGQDEGVPRRWGEGAGDKTRVAT